MRRTVNHMPSRMTHAIQPFRLAAVRPMVQLQPPPPKYPRSGWTVIPASGCGGGGTAESVWGVGVGSVVCSGSHCPGASVVEVQVMPGGQPFPPCPRQPSVHTSFTQIRPLVALPQSASAVQPTSSLGSLGSVSSESTTPLPLASSALSSLVP